MGTFLWICIFSSVPVTSTPEDLLQENLKIATSVADLGYWGGPLGRPYVSPPPRSGPSTPAPRMALQTVPSPAALLPSPAPLPPAPPSLLRARPASVGSPASSSSARLSILSSSKVHVSAVMSHVTNNLSLITKVLEFVGDFLFKFYTLDSCRLEASFPQLSSCCASLERKGRFTVGAAHRPRFLICPGLSVQRRGSSSGSPRGATLQRQH